MVTVVIRYYSNRAVIGTDCRKSTEIDSGAEWSIHNTEQMK